MTYYVSSGTLNPTHSLTHPTPNGGAREEEESGRREGEMGKEGRFEGVGREGEKGKPSHFLNVRTSLVGYVIHAPSSVVVLTDFTTY